MLKRTHRNFTRHLFAVLVVVGSAAGIATAQIRIWDADGVSPPDGIFGVGQNWNPDLAPSASDDVIFNIGDTYTVTLDDDEASGSASFLDGVVAIRSDSAGTVRNYTIGVGGLNVSASSRHHRRRQRACRSDDDGPHKRCRIGHH